MVQPGVHISEMELLTIGTLLDMYSEMKRDDEPYAALASQEGFDKFQLISAIKIIAEIS